MQVIQSFKDYFLRNSIDLVGLLSICIIYAIVIFINFRKSSQISMPKYLRSIKDIKDDDEFEYIEQVIKNFEQRDVNQLEFLKMKNESAIEGYKLVGMLTTFIALMVALLTYFIKTLCLSRAHLVFENQSILECFYGISILAIMLNILFSEDFMKDTKSWS